jgi:UDP-N-acetylglucosamine 3-dehydrogenase
VLPLRVGVIGAGIMGQNHIRTYSKMKGVELAGIADVDRARLDSLSKEYGCEGYTDYNEMLKKGLDAVSIVVPTTLHRKVALDSISAGANLMVEKPIADTVMNAECIVEAARRENVKLMVGHIERFNPAVMKMKNIIDSGELGKVVSISTRRVGPYNPRIRDVGVILDIGVHDIDIISYLYCAPVTEIYAIAGREIHSFEDHASILLRFANDKAGAVETNWLTPHKTRNFTVIGTEGVGYGDYMEQKVLIQDKEWTKEAKIEKKEPLLNELENFLQACGNGCDPLTTGEDGLHALKVAIAAIKSYTTKSAVKISPGGYFADRIEQTTGAVV